MKEKEKNLLLSSAALTGGIATGKSTAARFFSKLGACIIDTDRIAREIVEPGTPVLKRITEVFGNGFILPEGGLHREMLRDLIIKDPGKRNLLNSIMHPAIMKRVAELLSRHSWEEREPVIVDVPLLFESGWDSYFCRIILVYTPASLQIERLMERDGIDRETAELTLKAQIPVDEKRRRADFIIDNSGSREKTEEQVEKIYSKLVSVT